MTKPLSHQILSLSLAALLTAGVLSGMGGLADRQHRSAAMAMAKACQTTEQGLPSASLSSACLQALASPSAQPGHRS